MRKQVWVEEKTWATEEFAEVEFIDERLNYRCQKLAEALGQQPTASINQACEDWADSKAAYRFFENPDVSPKQILEPHSERSVERMKGYKIVLAIQDTTFFNYTHHPETQGLGEIGTKVTNQRGFGMHSTLAVAPNGQPLGVLTQAYVERPLGKAARTAAETKALKIEEKESYRWLEALEKTIAMAPEGVKVVTVCDREADIYELFDLAQKLHAPLLVRATENRCLDADEAKTLWPKLKQQSIQGELSVQINGNDKRKQRQATVSIRFCSVTLRPPWRPAPQKLPLITLQAVFVREDNPPENLAEFGDHEPIEWMLLTNTPVDNLEDALQVVSWYCCRWQIEVFHKIIKSGCRVEDCLLQTASRLQNYITLMCIVAWRLHWLTFINRTDPDSPCTQILTTVEWQALYLRIHKSTKFPQTPPSTHQAIRWIAQLGGFLARKSDGEPGITTIWRGWQRLQDFAATWSIIINDLPQLVGNR